MTGFSALCSANDSSPGSPFAIFAMARKLEAGGGHLNGGLDGFVANCVTF
jgi:hypothetical protein